MASVITTEFARTTSPDALPFSLIDQPGLLSRLVQVIKQTAAEFTSDPRGFFRGLLSWEAKDSKRRQRIRIGLACALVVHVALLSAIALLGWRTMFTKHVEDDKHGDVVWFPVKTPPDHKPSDGFIPRGEKDAGGGGGGDKNPLPATRGPLPQSSPNPQLVKPNTLSVVLPTIQVPPTIMGPDGTPPPPGMALGIPTGAIAAAPSPGPGEGEGLGGRRGSGAGTGSGPGTGPGENGSGQGKGRIGLPTGADDPKGPIPYNLIDKYPDRTPIVWLHRPTPITTPEAQANKVKGEVWLRATFGADGRITDIEVIRDVPYMTQSAMEALQRSTFRPATIKGRPVTLLKVPVRINVDVYQR